MESRLGKRYYQDATFWNESLTGWASSYVGGTLSIDLRNSITILLAKQLAPAATSMLDLGCAGATLALCLGPEFKTYCGVDISDVVVSKAKELLASSPLRNTALHYNLTASPVQDFKPPQPFDLIVFNEVLYYLGLSQVKDVIDKYSCFLAPGGLILISLKDDELSRLVFTLAAKKLKFEDAVLYQEKPQRPGWKTARNRENPASLVSAFRVISARRSVAGEKGPEKP
jgi:2-polyprenyl-3-methyl-5-hydroxy-6-metoxy-1,4-benzoquinol methylase